MAESEQRSSESKVEESGLSENGLDSNKTLKPSFKETQAKDRVKGIPDESLMHVYDEIEIHPKSQRQLKEIGVATVADLLNLRNDLRDGNIGVIRKAAQKQLYHFCLWYENFKTENEQDSAWRPHFTEDSFDKFVEGLNKASSSVHPDTSLNIAKALFDHAVSMLHEGSQGELSGLPQAKREALYDYIVQVVLEELHEDFLVRCNFDVNDLIKTCAKAIFNLPSGLPYPKIMLLAGRTQSGKTNVKTIVQSTCNLLRVYLVIITKGVAESKDLSKKIKRQLNEGKSEFDALWNDSNHDNRVLVIADTASQINNKAIPGVDRLRKAKPHAKFCVIVDECDAMYRTDESDQQMERAYEELMKLGPTLRIEISATPIPALLVFTRRGLHVEMLELGTSDDYSGVTEMKPLRDERGSAIYLSAKDITFKEGVSYKDLKRSSLKKCDTDLIFPEEDEGGRFKESEARVFSTSKSLKFIPSTDGSVMSLYEDALSGESSNGIPTKKGVLLLDCTLNRVYTENNIFQKAACVQNHFFRENKNVAVIVNVGSGIYIRRPGFLYGRKVTSKKTVSEVIERLDEELGLEMPVFVFGFTKMKRCISYRSDKRVPTHMVLSLGLGQSNENFIQALGRATFNGLESVLLKNGFSHVTVLTSRSDLAMARKYQNFVHDVAMRLKEGATPEEILEDGDIKFLDESNYIRHTNRKTGQIKGLKNMLPSEEKFESPDSLDDEDVYIGDDVNKRVMKAVLDLIYESRSDDSGPLDEGMGKDGEGDPLADRDGELKEINGRGFTQKEIMVKYNDTYQQDGAHSIKGPVLKKVLTMLKVDAILEQTDNNRWRAKCLRDLKMQCSQMENIA